MADVDMLESDYDEAFSDDNSGFDSNVEAENHVPAKNQKASNISAAKTSALSVNKNAANISRKSNGKTVEQIYQKKTQLEHILLRPDTYIGSTERVEEEMYVLDQRCLNDPDDASNSDKKISKRLISYTPGLYKIFDEIIVNAADNKQRDPNMDKLDVTIDQVKNIISVKNNGKGIPVVEHKEHKCYVPTLIFGHLLTGSNFDDNEQKTTGGRNGYGAKLANIFSSEFTVECVDSSNGLKFVQVFRNNMTNQGEPTVKSCTAAEKKAGDYTKITFSPDLVRFKMDKLDDDIVALFSKRAYDIAGSMANRHGKKLMVSLNGKKLPIKSFKDYLNLFHGIEAPQAYEKIGDEWEVGVGVSTDGAFQQISFVNAISTTKGGGHTNCIAEQVSKYIIAAVKKKKNKGAVDVKPNLVKSHMFVFVNCLISNPTFDSQTKEFLTTKPKAFGSNCELSAKFLKAVEKSGIVEAVIAYNAFKQGQALKRISGKKTVKLTGIAKLDDANFAGTAKSVDCTLIITEGDSAKSLAMSGLSVVGRDYYGVFPLKGKPLNVREATDAVVKKNEEIKNLLDIMGLQIGVEYNEANIKKLRYGHLMIMADQDNDGSHIKGLVINFLHKFWPSLLDIPGFLQQFITPIVKASKGKRSQTFFTLPEYENFKASTGNDAKGFTIKYYKGLGTSTAAEAKEYFSNLGLHEIHFQPLSDDVCTPDNVVSADPDDMDFDVLHPVPDKAVSGSDLIDMVFAKARVEDRKVWLNNLKKDTYLNYAEAQGNGVKYSDFVNREFILFSQADNARSIPHVMDGFKPSQRKILFACFKRKLKNEIKVAQLAGYVSEHSAYHHGEASLTGAIIGMAQNFCGSNNINLLTPSGQFGTRRMGGKDAASPRYVFTKLENVTRTIFHPDDDELLNYLNDDGLSIEPEFYVPVIPMVLVNGSDGIGTGWSSTVPTYDPRGIIANIRRLIRGEEQEKLHPFYYGYGGEIVPESGKRQGSYTVSGKIERINNSTLLISELPIKKWTQDYKQFLEEMLVGAEKKDEKKTDKKKTDKTENPEAEFEIKDFNENHTDATVSFTISVGTPEMIDIVEAKEKNGLLGKFKLTTSVGTSNMHLFNEEGRIEKYETPEDIISSFFSLRLDFYSKRKALLLAKLRRDQMMLSNKARFVEEVCSGDLVVSNRKRAVILADLQKRGFDLMEKAKDDIGQDEDEIDDNKSDAELARGYEYLLGMKIWSLTFEKAEELRAQLAEKTATVAELEATAPSKLWLNDLDSIEVALDERDAEMASAAADEIKAQNKSKKAVQSKKKAAAKKGNKKTGWNSEEESDSGDDFKALTKTKTPLMKPLHAGLKNPMVQAKPLSKPKPIVRQREPAPTVMDKKEDNFFSDSSEDEDLSSSLADRMRKKLMVSPAPKKSRSDFGTASCGSNHEVESDDELEMFDSKEFKPASVTPARKMVATVTKPVINKIVGKKPVITKQAKPLVAAPSRAKKTSKVPIKKKNISKMDSDSEEFSEPEVAPRARSGRARKAIVYSLSGESDSDGDSE